MYAHSDMHARTHTHTHTHTQRVKQEGSSHSHSNTVSHPARFLRGFRRVLSILGSSLNSLSPVHSHALQWQALHVAVQRWRVFVLHAGKEKKEAPIIYLAWEFFTGRPIFATKLHSFTRKQNGGIKYKIKIKSSMVNTPALFYYKIIKKTCHTVSKSKALNIHTLLAQEEDSRFSSDINGEIWGGMDRFFSFCFDAQSFLFALL